MHRKTCRSTHSHTLRCLCRRLIHQKGWTVYFLLSDSRPPLRRSLVQSELGLVKQYLFSFCFPFLKWKQKKNCLSSDAGRKHHSSWCSSDSCAALCLLPVSTESWTVSWIKQLLPVWHHAIELPVHYSSSAYSRPFFSRACAVWMRETRRLKR